MTLLSPLMPPTGSELTFDNYKKVFTNKYLQIGFKNTIIILAVSLVFNVMLGTITTFLMDYANAQQGSQREQLRNK